MHSTHREVEEKSFNNAFLQLIKARIPFEQEKYVGEEHFSRGKNKKWKNGSLFSDQYRAFNSNGKVLWWN